MERDELGMVLLDVSPGAAAAFESAFLAKTGHPAAVCQGPGDETCPLIATGGCDMFEQAHGIVFQLDLDRPEHRDIVERYRLLAGPELPIRVVVTAEQAKRYSALLDQFEVWTHEPNAAELDGFAAEVEAVDRQYD